MFLKLSIQFIIGIAVGIYGYLIPGYINLTVLQLGLQKNTSALWKTLIILAIIEIPYCIICMNGMQWFMQQTLVRLIVQWLIVAIMILLAILSFLETRKEHEQKTIDTTKVDSKRINRLLLLAIFNPFQLSAWAIWGAYFIEKSWFIWTKFSIFIFSLGASLGVFLILWSYAFTGHKLLEYFSINRKYIDYSVSILLFILALVQVARNLS